MRNDDAETDEAGSAETDSRESQAASDRAHDGPATFDGDERPHRSAWTRGAGSESSTSDEVEVGAEPDDAFSPADEAVLGPAPDLRQGHNVIDPGALRAEVGDRFELSEDEATSAEEATRLRRLRAYTADPDLLYKRHLIADAALIERLVAVRTAAPNARVLLDIITGAARVSALTGAALDIPPILIVGPPGCGKSYVVREVARALAVPLLGLLGSTLSDAAAITGTAVGWRGAAPGQLADLLLRAPTSGPVVFIDEIEKLRVWDRRDSPADVLLGLLDKAMASQHQDLYYRVAMRADRATFLFAANSVENLSAPFLDRVVVVELAAPDRDERRAIVRRVHEAMRERLGLDAAADLDDGIVDALGEMSLRRAGPALQLAFGRAAESGRTRLTPEDIAWARRQVERGSEPARRRIGFRPHSD